MAETVEMNWNEVDVDENISEQDQKASENVGVTTPVAKMLCTVAESSAVEKTFKEYSCIAASLKFRIDDVYELEMPVLDKNNNPIMRDGEPLVKRRPLNDKERAEANALYAGRTLFDEVNLYHAKEKEGMKNRRLFVAKRIGLISTESSQLTTKMWAAAPGKQTILTTEWNHWKDKMSGEARKNVRVGFSGYEAVKNAANQAPQDDEDFSNL